MVKDLRGRGSPLKHNIYCGVTISDRPEGFWQRRFAEILLLLVHQSEETRTTAAIQSITGPPPEISRTRGAIILQCRSFRACVLVKRRFGSSLLEESEIVVVPLIQVGVGVSLNHLITFEWVGGILEVIARRIPFVEDAFRRDFLRKLANRIPIAADVDAVEVGIGNLEGWEPYPAIGMSVRRAPEHGKVENAKRTE